jgi:DNA-binding response OmpR family regulator
MKMERAVLYINHTSTRSSGLEVLKKERFQVDMVRDYDEALERLEFRKYAVVILQVPPLAESWQFCSDVRSISSIPLIVISNNASTEVCVKAINAGADFFLRKPIGPQELLARIRALMYRSSLQTRRPASQSVPTG